MVSLLSREDTKKKVLLSLDNIILDMPSGTTTATLQTQGELAQGQADMQKITRREPGSSLASRLVAL